MGPAAAVEPRHPTWGKRKVRARHARTKLHVGRRAALMVLANCIRLPSTSSEAQDRGMGEMCRPLSCRAPWAPGVHGSAATPACTRMPERSEHQARGQSGTIPHSVTVTALQETALQLQRYKPRERTSVDPSGVSLHTRPSHLTIFRNMCNSPVTRFHQPGYLHRVRLPARELPPECFRNLSL